MITRLMYRASTYLPVDTSTTGTRIWEREGAERRKAVLPEEEGKEGKGDAGDAEWEGSGLFLEELASIAMLSSERSCPRRICAVSLLSFLELGKFRTVAAIKY